MKNTIEISLSTYEWIQLEAIRANLQKESISQLIEQLIKERLKVINYASHRKN